MTLHPISLLAVATILAALALGWSRRFLAVGALAVGNVVVFVMTLVAPQVITANGMLSIVQADLALYAPNIFEEPLLAALQVLTSMFVHADFFHLFGNMLILLAFGLPFEDRVGGRRFLLVYLLGGLFGTVTQVFVRWPEPMLLLGASGAIFGIIGGFAASYPNLIVPLPVPLFIVTFFMRMRVWVGAILFGAMQLLLLSIVQPGEGGVAYFAHLGGLAGGVLVGLTLIKGQAPAHRSPVAVDLEALSPFARDNGTAAALSQMRSNHDEPQIFQAWLDRFFRTASCPQCSHKVMPRHHGEIVCTQGHRFDVRRNRQQPIRA